MLDEAALGASLEADPPALACILRCWRLRCLRCCLLLLLRDRLDLDLRVSLVAPLSRGSGVVAELKYEIIHFFIS